MALRTTHVATATAVVDTIRTQRIESFKVLEGNFQSTQEWLAATIEAYTQQVRQHSSRSPVTKKRKTYALASDLIEWVKSLKVKELQVELRSRDLDGTGVKKVLRERLLLSMEQEQRNKCREAKKIDTSQPLDQASIAVDHESEKQMLMQAEMGNEPMEDVVVETESSKQVIPQKDESPNDAPQQENPESQTWNEKEQVQEDEQPQEMQSEDPPAEMKRSDSIKESKSPLRSQSPKRSRSPLKNLQSSFQSAKRMFSKSPEPPKQQNKEENTNQQSEALDNAPNENQPLPSTNITKIITTPAINMTSKSAATTSLASMSSSLKAKMDARKAKLEEMRSKSKPIMGTKNFSATLGLSSFKSTDNNSMDGKKQNLAAKMREKALKKIEGLEKDNEDKSTSEGSSADKDILSVAKILAQSAGKLQSPFSAKSTNSSPRSPMDTYEMSDHGESDSDEDSEPQPKKRVPDWALRQNLCRALEIQYGSKNRIDPDEIFGEVQTCDLEAIFDQKKSRYMRRTSSGNWTNDKVTLAEKLAFKRVMGYSVDAQVQEV